MLNPDRTRAASPPRGLLRALRRVVGAEGLITGEERLRPFECDGLAAYRQLPAAVVLPADESQVREVLRLCHRHGIAVVARGAGTGLSGGALPLAGSIVLSLTRMDRILNIRPDELTATVQPGVRNLAISEAAAPHGLYYAPDPSSQIACTIGGNVAENAGGVHCLKYGLTLHNCEGLRGLTIEGEPFTAGGPGPDAAGSDLLAGLLGSEGLLAVVTEITVRLRPRPQAAAVALAGFPTVADAAGAVAAIIGAGITPAGLEMMDQLAARAAEAFCGVGYPTDTGALLLCEVDGNAEEVQAELGRVLGHFAAHGADPVSVAEAPEERARLWAGRKAAFPAVGRIAPDYFCMDGTIPRAALAATLEAIAGLSARYELPVANVFHAGDGNLHPLIAFDANDPDALARAERLGGEILELCIAAGGTVTGEHGVGVEKLAQMCVQFAPGELEQFHRFRRAFDEHGLLNPGKAVPTLNRCAEFGRMHVRGGETRFPDLPRF